MICTLDWEAPLTCTDQGGYNTTDSPLLWPFRVTWQCLQHTAYLLLYVDPKDFVLRVYINRSNLLSQNNFLSTVYLFWGRENSSGRYASGNQHEDVRQAIPVFYLLSHLSSTNSLTLLKCWPGPGGHAPSTVCKDPGLSSWPLPVVFIQSKLGGCRQHHGYT